MPPQRPSPQCPSCRATRWSPPGRARAQALDAAAPRPASDISPGCACRARLQKAALPAGQAVETAAARTPPQASSGGDGAAAGAAETLALRPECTTGTTPAQLGRVFASQSAGAGLLGQRGTLARPLRVCFEQDWTFNPIERDSAGKAR